ncbi:MAG: hypothetical protein FJZ01_10760 [Candidatus Sericytochromatia bacterium]|nr:hypothetical protein [Candidatus Tanganyikabacteria bacterium]
MQKAIAVTLAASVFSLSLAGCGSRPAGTPAPLSGQAQSKVEQASAPALTAAQLAQQFAGRVEAQSGRRPIVRGSEVVLPTAEGEPAIYDFAQTPRTGMVTFRAGDLETKFKYDAQKDEITGKAVPAILVAIAVKMVWGGTKAFVKYWITHPGDKFSKKDCVKAVVFGMVAEGLTAIPVVGGVLSSILWPIAWKWVSKWLDEHLPWDAGKILAMGMELKGEVAEALQEALAQSQQ